MELTWQDIDKLITLNEVFSCEFHRSTYRSKEYCEELLKRFNKIKKNE